MGDGERVLDEMVCCGSAQEINCVNSSVIFLKSTYGDWQLSLVSNLLEHLYIRLQNVHNTTCGFNDDDVDDKAAFRKGL